MTLQPFVERHKLAGAVTLLADKDKILVVVPLRMNQINLG
jgi:hypothetical protein